MEFTTSTGLVSIKGDVLQEKKFFELSRSKSYPVYFLIALIVLRLSSFNEKPDKTREAVQFIALIIIGLALLVYLVELVDFILFRVWGKKIIIQKIKEIKVKKGAIALETDMVIKLQSNRTKMYHFRVLENQLEPFIEALQNINPNILVARE